MSSLALLLALILASNPVVAQSHFNLIELMVEHAEWLKIELKDGRRSTNQDVTSSGYKMYFCIMINPLLHSFKNEPEAASLHQFYFMNNAKSGGHKEGGSTEDTIDREVNVRRCTFEGFSRW